MCPTRTIQIFYINDFIWLYWLAMYVEYNSTGVCRPPGSGCSTGCTGPVSAPAYISACSAQARHGSSYTGSRIPWGIQSNVRSAGLVSILTWFYLHISSGSLDTGCTGYTSQGRSDTGGTWGTNTNTLYLIQGETYWHTRRDTRGLCVVAGKGSSLMRLTASSTIVLCRTGSRSDARLGPGQQRRSRRNTGPGEGDITVRPGSGGHHADVTRTLSQALNQISDSSGAFIEEHIDVDSNMDIYLQRETIIFYIDDSVKELLSSLTQLIVRGFSGFSSIVLHYSSSIIPSRIPLQNSRDWTLKICWHFL